MQFCSSYLSATQVKPVPRKTQFDPGQQLSLIAAPIRPPRNRHAPPSPTHLSPVGPCWNIFNEILFQHDLLNSLTLSEVLPTVASTWSFRNYSYFVYFVIILKCLLSVEQFSVRLVDVNPSWARKTFVLSQSNDEIISSLSNIFNHCKWFIFKESNNVIRRKVTKLPLYYSQS